MNNPIFDSGLKKEDLDLKLVFSPSQLDTWDRCQKLGQYVYRLGYRQESNDRAAKRGSIFHWMLQRYYEGKSVIEILELAEEEYKTYEEQSLVFECSGILYRYSEYWKQNGDKFKVLACEQYILVPYTTPRGRQVYLNGYVDLIVEDNGHLIVIDHKTGQRHWTKKMVWFDRQLMIYCFMLHTLGFTPHEGQINNVKTTIIKDLQRKLGSELFSRVGNNLSASRLQNYMKHVGTTIDNILDLEDYALSMKRDCSGCNFQEACNMILEDVDPTAYLDTNFKLMKNAANVKINIKGLPRRA